MTVDEQKVISKAIKGDNNSFLKLCEIESKQILYVCVKIMGNYQDGEDAAQEVFIKMFKNIQSLSTAAAYPVWVNKLIMNTCFNLKKIAENKKVKVPIENFGEMVDELRDGFLPIKYVEKKEEQQLLMQVIDSLSSKDKAVIVMYYYESLSLLEIADVLDTTKSAVDHRLRRARETIKRKLGVYNDVGMPSNTEPKYKLPIITQAMQQEANSLLPTNIVESFAATAKLQTAGAAATVSGATATKVIGGVLVAGMLTAGLAGVFAQNSPAAPISSLVPNSFVVSENNNLAVPQQPSSEISPQRQELDIYANSGESTATSSTSEQPSPKAEETLPASMHKIAVAGRVTLHSVAAAEETSSPVGYLQGLTVQLVTPENTVVARTKTDENGNYSFSSIQVNANQEYTVKLNLLNRTDLALWEGKENGMQFAIPENANTINAPPILVTSNKTPALLTKMYIKNGQRGAVNPVSCEIMVLDDFETQTTWQIIEQETGTIVTQGVGTQISSEALHPKVEGSPATYILRITCVNQAGNPTQREDTFIVTP